MKFLIISLLFMIHLNSYAQNLIWKQYIDDDNKDEALTYLHTHKNNRYIFSMTESYSGSKAYEDYIISLTKTTLSGDLLWTKYYRPSGNSYKYFGVSNVIFKDSLILIYGSCKDTFLFDHKFICELSLDGEERFSKVYEMRSTYSSFHANYSDSSTIEYVYNDYKISKHAYVELYNKKHELIHIDSNYISIEGAVYRIHQSNVFIPALFQNGQNKLGIKLYHFDKNWNSIDSSILLSDITMYPASIPLFHYSKYGEIDDNNEMSIWGVYDFNSSKADNFYLEINLGTKEIKESYNSRRITNENYTVSSNSSIYKEHKGNTYLLYRLYNKDSTEKYKFRIAKFNNGNTIWSIDLKKPNNSIFDGLSTSISLELNNNKLLAVVTHFDQSLLTNVVVEYDTNGNYLRSYQEFVDTNCVQTTSLSTIYNNSTEILSLARVTLKTKNDKDLLWKKTSFEPVGFTSEINAEISLYPNPTSTEITIADLNEKEFTIEVFDLLGNKLFEVNNNPIINVMLLPVGMYILRFNSNKQTFSKKFFKE